MSVLELLHFKCGSLISTLLKMSSDHFKLSWNRLAISECFGLEGDFK